MCVCACVCGCVCLGEGAVPPAMFPWAPPGVNEYSLPSLSLPSPMGPYALGQPMLLPLPAQPASLGRSRYGSSSALAAVEIAPDDDGEELVAPPPKRRHTASGDPRDAAAPSGGEPPAVVVPGKDRRRGAAGTPGAPAVDSYAPDADAAARQDSLDGRLGSLNMSLGLDSAMDGLEVPSGSGQLAALLRPQAVSGALRSSLSGAGLSIGPLMGPPPSVGGGVLSGGGAARPGDRPRDSVHKIASLQEPSHANPSSCVLQSFACVGADACCERLSVVCGVLSLVCTQDDSKGAILRPGSGWRTSLHGVEKYHTAAAGHTHAPRTHAPHKQPQSSPPLSPHGADGGLPVAEEKAAHAHAHTHTHTHDKPSGRSARLKQRRKQRSVGSGASSSGFQAGGGGGERSGGDEANCPRVTR